MKIFFDFFSKIISLFRKNYKNTATHIVFRYEENVKNAGNNKSLA